ncbi:ATP-dependent DNA/RNA helicase DHX36-like [Watersipora subatra]|uniref:ATP-dependent DNA/RNA helicase DHX36-like n=1 Tax=Watersipora subatra TaxID=2589382 RepID=UPI00355C6236
MAYRPRFGGRGHRRRYSEQQYASAEGSSQDASQEGSNYTRRPPGLRGKEIGLWYARRGQAKREHANRLHVTLDEQSVENIEKVLHNHGRNDSAPSSSAWSSSSSASQHSSRWRDHKPYNHRSHEYRPSDHRSHDHHAQGHQSHDHGPDNYQKNFSTRSKSPSNWSQDHKSARGTSKDPRSHVLELIDQKSLQGKYKSAEGQANVKTELSSDDDIISLLDDETTDEFKTEDTSVHFHPTSEEMLASRLRDDPVRNKVLKDELIDRNTQGCPLLDFRKMLPSYQMQDQVLEVIRDNQVVVISGETGCGKTTQVPQFILDDHITKNQGSTCHVICTQPRRISAISVAERVAEERGESLGASVGYSIRLSHSLPRSYGSITYCTTGILLRILTHNKHLTNYSHVIVDEVHERDIQTDFLLILLRDLLPSRPDLKVILMSATLNAENFSEYFYNAAMFNIPGFTFPVTEYYLEDIMDTVRYNAADGPRISLKGAGPSWSRYNRKQKEEEKADLEKLRTWLRDSHLSLSDKATENILEMDHNKIHPKLVAELIKHICRMKPEGAILVFLPGWSDISDVNKIISSSLSNMCTNIIPLHSLMPTREQKGVFLRSPAGVRKIVLATNIAETSITIDDIVYVINAGKIKLTGYLSEGNMNSLQSVWVSKANARQRRGRAGRVQPGICYHLYTRHHEASLEEYQQPEMVRSRLENVCLDVKLLKQGYVQPFLLKAMNPPSLEAIESSLQLLRTLDALDEEERLTPLGYHLAQMPLDPHTGKMVLMAAVFSCLDPVLSIAACLNYKDPFQVPLDKVKEVDKIRHRLSQNSFSDLIMYYYAIKGWEDASNKSAYCWDNFLSASTVSLVHKMKGQFAELLHKLKFISSSSSTNQEANQNSGNMSLVRAVVCAGLYPNVAKVKCIGKRQIMKLSTKTEKGIKFHPKSVNSEGDLTKHGQWIMYYELLKINSTVTVMDSTLMPALPIMFFGGELRLEMKGDDELVPKYQAVIVNDWISFECDWKYAELINELRKQLNDVLQDKIANPLPTNWNTDLKEGATLQAIVDLLGSDITARASPRNRRDNTRP